MAAGTCASRLFLAVLFFSYLISNNVAIPFTRSRDLVQKSQPHQVALDNLEKTWKLESIVRRMEIEVNDYPGSGANNRHTPRPQPGRGCIDC